MMGGGGLMYLFFIVIFLTSRSLCNRIDEDGEYIDIYIGEDSHKRLVFPTFPRNVKDFIEYIADVSYLGYDDLYCSTEKPTILFRSYRNGNPSLISNKITATNIDEQNPSSLENKTSNIKNVKQNVECALRIQKDDEVSSVIIVNSSSLLKALKRNETTSVKECVVVLFFSPQCVFSARMAPYYNALARIFPGLPFYALDVTKEFSIDLLFGVLGVPSVFFYYDGKFFKTFNETVVNIDNLVNFITRHTNLTHNGVFHVLSIDKYGPVPSVLTVKTDYILILAWIFTIVCICIWFIQSSFCHRMVENIRNTWYEAEAQHNHAD